VVHCGVPAVKIGFVGDAVVLGRSSEGLHIL
jgi:hypothetical protein